MVIESVELETDGRGQEVLVARGRGKAGAARRCSRCQAHLRQVGVRLAGEPRRGGAPIITAASLTFRGYCSSTYSVPRLALSSSLRPGVVDGPQGVLEMLLLKLGRPPSR